MKAKLLALTAVLFWSTAASAFKITLEWLSPYQLVLLSSAVSTAVLWLSVLVRRRRLPASIRRNRLLRAAARGALNPFLYYLVLLEAYDRLPAQIAMVVNYLWPVVLMILSVPILKQAITVRMAVASLVSFCGVGVLALGGDPQGGDLPLPALGLALLSTVIWALFWVLNVRWKGDEVNDLADSFLFGLVYLLLYGIATDGISGITSVDPRGVMGTVYVGLFEMGITFVIWLKALRLARTTSEAGNFIFLTPFLALFFIGTAVGETIGISTVVGLILVMTGILIQNRTRGGSDSLQPV